MFENKEDLINFHVAAECCFKYKIDRDPGREASFFRSKKFYDLDLKDKSVKAPRIILFRLMKEKFRSIANK